MTRRHTDDLPRPLGETREFDPASAGDPSEAGPRMSDLLDRFEREAPPGAVIGSNVSGRGVRRGVDAERVISIDHGALRIGQVERAGWGRHGLAYGPFERTAGLAFVTVVMNGHNASWTGPPEEKSFLERLRRTASRWAARIIPSRVPPNPPPPYSTREERESMALGWYGRPVPSAPDRSGHRLFIRAAGPRNGDLHAGMGRRSPRVARNVPNVPLVLAISLRERGAAYYGAFAKATDAAGTLPSLRPLAITLDDASSPVYAGLFQNVLGEIGFSVDTRVYGVQVRRLHGPGDRFGTAHAADAFSVDPLRRARGGEERPRWEIPRGECRHEVDEVVLSGGEPLLVSDPGVRSGLVRAAFRPPADGARIGLVWRYRSPDDYWRTCCSERRIRISRVEEGVAQVVREEELSNVVSTVRSETGTVDLQVVDRGNRVDVLLDGHELVTDVPAGEPSSDATGVGLTATGSHGTGTFREFEAHPASVSFSDELELRSPWRTRETERVVKDEFRGSASSLDGRVSPAGTSWRKELGRGEVCVDGSGRARVKADRADPNPERTAYTTSWDDPAFAEIRSRIVPPGTRPGDDERGRGGVIFVQDPDNYLIVNNWFNDSYGGASVSSFLRYDGREDLFRAVWTNVGTKIRRGVPYELAVAFDGVHYVVRVDDRPVLFRAVHDIYPEAERLRIHRIGLAVNWEWGNDTGTAFHRFEAREQDVQRYE